MKIAWIVLFFSTTLLSKVKDLEVPYRNISITLENEIEKVTTFSDRAKITRVAKLNKLKSNSKGWIHFGSLPHSLKKDSIRVKLLNADANSIEQVIIEDSFEQVVLDSTIKSQIDKIKILYGNSLDLNQQKRLLEEKYFFVKNLRFAAPFSKDNFTYQRFNAPIGQIGLAIDSTQNSSKKMLKSLQTLNDKLKAIHEEIIFLNKQLQTKTNTSTQRWMTNVYVKLQKSISTSGHVQLSYFIPNAWWYPIYDIRADLDLKKGRANIRLITGGLVEQHTGENWKNVEMLLSTLDPTPLYLPLLPKWSFSEVREEAKVGRIDNISSNSKVFESMVSAASPSLRTSKKQSRKRKMDEKEFKRKLKLSKSEMVARESIMATDEMGDAKVMPSSQSIDFAKGNKNRAQKVTRGLFPLKPLQNIFSDFNALDSKLKRLATGQKQYSPYHFTMTTKPLKINYKNSSLPARIAKGRKIELKSPFNIDLKNDEEPLKIPLNSQTLYGELSYLTIPKKDKRVFLRAKTKNTTATPLLAGKAQVFMNGDLITKTNLKTIDEGSHFTVELGVDKGIETQRLVKKKSEENGLVFKSHSTNVEVKIEVSNSHNFPINIVIKDHYPLAPSDEIIVELKTISPNATYKKNGYITWETSIKAKEKKQLIFNYNVTHPENYIVSEFN